MISPCQFGPFFLKSQSSFTRSEVAKATDPTFFDPTVSLGKGLDIQYSQRCKKGVGAFIWFKDV